MFRRLAFCAALLGALAWVESAGATNLVQCQYTKTALDTSSFSFDTKPRFVTTFDVDGNGWSVYNNNYVLDVDRGRCLFSQGEDTTTIYIDRTTRVLNGTEKTDCKSNSGRELGYIYQGNCR
jgi:hypothetical protein